MCGLRTAYADLDFSNWLVYGMGVSAALCILSLLRGIKCARFALTTIWMLAFFACVHLQLIIEYVDVVALVIHIAKWRVCVCVDDKFEIIIMHDAYIQYIKVNTNRSTAHTHTPVLYTAVRICPLKSILLYGGCSGKVWTYQPLCGNTIIL